MRAAFHPGIAPHDQLHRFGRLAHQQWRELEECPRWLVCNLSFVALFVSLHC